MGVEVKQCLERDYDVILSLQEIRALSLNQLEEIGAGNVSAKNSQENDSSSDGTKQVISELAYKPVTVPTIKLNSVEKGTPVFVIPPIEGEFSVVKPLAELLKRPVIGLNWVKDLNESKTIQEVAKYFIQQCKLLANKAEKLDVSFNINNSTVNY